MRTRHYHQSTVGCRGGQFGRPGRRRLAVRGAIGADSPRTLLTSPWQAVKDADGEPVLLAPGKDSVQTINHDTEQVGTFVPDHAIGDVSPAELAGLVLPGGVVNPDKLRLVPDAVGFVKAFAAAGKPVAATCHGPWTLVEAGVVKGKALTSWPSLQTDIRNAGGE